MTELILPTNPVEIALPFAVDIEISSVVDEEIVQDETIKRSVDDLHYIASPSGLVDKRYIVDVNSGLLIPKDAEEDDEVEADILESTVFEGRFKYYQAVRKKVEGCTIRGLYLAFDDSITVPYSSRLENNSLVHISVFDVTDINKLSA
jgi:hypothetical protein